MNEFEIYTKLQNLLMSINENVSISQICNFILKNQLLKKENLLFSTMKLLASYAYSRPKQLTIISSILKKIPKLNLNLDMIHFDCDGVYTDQEIIERIQIIYYLLFNSSHITEFEYKNIIKRINDSFNFFFNGYKYERRIEYFIILDLHKNCNILYEAIFNDDIDLLQNIIEQTNWNIEETFVLPLFELYDYFKSSNLLEYSAFYGSVHCFKFLLFKSEKIDFGRLLEYAIAGGNVDIIHITENMSHDMDITKNRRLLYIAISFMQNELIEYIVNIYGIKINGECYIKCINAANYSAMIMLNDLENSASINEFGNNGLTPLIDAAYEGFFEFLVYLLSIDKVDYIKKSRDNESVLYYANINQNYKIIDYIIKNKLFSSSDCSLFCYGNVNDVYIHYQEIEELEKLKYNWIDIKEIANNEDEKDYMIRKRFYDSKFKNWRGKRYYSLKRREKKERFNYSLYKRKKKFIKNQKRKKNRFLIRSAVKEQIQ